MARPSKRYKSLRALTVLGALGLGALTTPAAELGTGGELESSERDSSSPVSPAIRTSKTSAR